SISLPPPRPSRPEPSGHALQQAEDAFEGPAIGRPEHEYAVQSRLVEDRLQLREGVEAPFAVIGAHAAGADAAEGLVLLPDMPQAVVDGDAAGQRLGEHALAIRPVGAEPVERQRMIAG